jgi:hypothetical protein
MLEHAGTGDGVQVLLFTEKAAMEKTLKYVVAGNTTQMNDPAFVREVQAWIHFGRAEAVRTGDGLFAGSSGTPSVPRWPGSPLFGGSPKPSTAGRSVRSNVQPRPNGPCHRRPRPKSQVSSSWNDRLPSDNGVGGRAVRNHGATWRERAECVALDERT